MNDTADAGVTEYHLPCAEALLAGTLALMTAYAQSRCPEHRELLAAKIIGNFGALTRHPALSIPFCASISQIRGQWQRLARQESHCEASGRDAAIRQLH